MLSLSRPISVRQVIKLPETFTKSNTTSYRPKALSVIVRMASSASDQVKYLSQDEAIKLDQELFNDYQFSVDQLMEVAGLSVAQVIQKCYPTDKFKTAVVCCGSGNNGGDGLVCARFLKLFGYQPRVICPRPGQGKLYQNLLHQAAKFGISITYKAPPDASFDDTDLIVDAIFGFSYKPPNRYLEYSKLLRLMHELSSKVPLICIDIPSGWHVEAGAANIESSQASTPEEMRIPALKPDCLVSLTAPKLCAKSFSGCHYLGSRFIPDPIIEKYQLYYPPKSSGFEPIKLGDSVKTS